MNRFLEKVLITKSAEPGMCRESVIRQRGAVTITVFNSNVGHAVWPV